MTQRNRAALAFAVGMALAAIDGDTDDVATSRSPGEISRSAIDQDHGERVGAPFDLHTGLD